MSDEAEVPDLLLWLDLETTGSDEAKDGIIEVGCILSTTDLTPIAEYSRVVQPEPEAYGRMMLNPVVREMHEANGLLAEIQTADQRIHLITNSLIAWATYNGAMQGRLVLAGSGVAHFDRRFIKKYMPQLDNFMRYWSIDIGVVRRSHDLWVGTKVSTANDGKTHRALDDARCHLAEAQAFRNLWYWGSTATAGQFGSDWWEADPEFSREDWQYEVANSDTMLGYHTWVAVKREESTQHAP